jgi:NAD(P)H-nitrite reductase large subunit
VAQIGNATRAGTGCGGCASDLATLLAEASSSAGNTTETIAKPPTRTMET